MVHWLCMTLHGNQNSSEMIEIYSCKFIYIKQWKYAGSVGKKNNWQDMEEIWSLICNGN